MKRPIEIVGGGLAGLTLGIALRQRSVPVELHEAGDYPRHRVCGEFISGRGLDVLNEMGLLGKVQSSGARLARTAVFFSGRTRSTRRELPRPALCISRFQLDALLANEFRSCGGSLVCRSRKTSFGESVVRATGRRIHSVVDGWRWFGLKVHARNVPLDADLEMHLMRDGYVGLCRLSDEEVNVCGLFRSRRPVPGLGSDWKGWLCGEEGSVLADRMSSAVFNEASFCSIAGISLERERITSLRDCSVGDAITMIPPVTGNGMSLAFESASLAVEPLVRFHRGTIDWKQVCHEVAQASAAAFNVRLRWAAVLQQVMMNPFLNTGMMRMCSAFPGLWQYLFQKTRS